MQATCGTGLRLWLSDSDRGDWEPGPRETWIVLVRAPRPGRRRRWRRWRRQVIQVFRTLRVRDPSPLSVPPQLVCSKMYVIFGPT